MGGNTKSRIAEGLLGATAIVAGAYTHQGWLATGGLALLSGSIANRTPKLQTGSINVLNSTSSPTAGLPIPYGKTGVVAYRDPERWPVGIQGQPLFGVVPLGYWGDTGEQAGQANPAKPPGDNYLWMVAAICHGPIRSVDTVYVNGRPALMYVETTGIDGLLAPRLQAIRPAAPGAGNDAEQAKDQEPDFGPQDFTDVICGQIAFGTDGQCGPIACQASETAYHVIGSVQTDHTTRLLTTTEAHPFQIGDAVDVFDVAGLSGNNENPYLVIKVLGTHQFMVRDPLGAGGGDTGNPLGNPGGIVLFSNKFTGGTSGWDFQVLAQNAHSGTIGSARGQGICYLWLRFTADQVRYNGQVPKITVACSGIAGVEPRGGLLTTSRVIGIDQVYDAGSVQGVPGDSETNQAMHFFSGGPTWRVGIHFTTTHGLAEGDIIEISGTGTIADGIQRADRIVDTHTIYIFICNLFDGATLPNLTGLTEAQAVTRTEITNPVMAIRDYLTNKTYGLGVPDVEIDDTLFAAAADYADQTIDMPRISEAGWFNEQPILATTPSSGTTVISMGPSGMQAGTPSTDSFGTPPDTGGVLTNGDHVVIENSSIPGLNGHWIISGVVIADTNDLSGQFTVPFDSTAFGSTSNVGNIVVQDALKRFSVAGILNSNETLKTNLERLCLCCRATVVYQVGRYYVTIRQATTSVVDLTQDDIVGNWSFELPGHDKKMNVMRATYIEPLNGFQYDQVCYPNQSLLPVPGEEHNTFLDQDQGQYAIRDIELPLVDVRTRAITIAQVYRRESRVAYTVSFTARERALLMSVGDLFTVTHETTGFDQEPFWCTSLSPLPNGLVQVVGEGYDSTSYDLDALDTTPFAALTHLPSPTRLQLPQPIITNESEATSKDGDGEGLVHVKIQFDAATDHINLYASESVASAGARPDVTANGLAGLVHRHEGTIAGANGWKTEFDIATTPSYYRQVIAIPYNSGGVVGQPIKFEAQALDIGTPPSAKPTGLTVDLSVLGQSTISFTINDPNSEHRIWRNGYVLFRLPVGENSLLDTGLSADELYLYNVQAIRNGQTSEFAVAGSGIGGTSGQPTLAAPTWISLQPLVIPSFGADLAAMIVTFSNPDPLANTQVWMSHGTGAPGDPLLPYALVATVDPGISTTVLTAPGVGIAAIPATRFFYLIATRGGYISSPQSDTLFGTFAI